MDIYFENSYGDKRIISKVRTLDDAFKAIHDFLDKHDFKSYYNRYYYTDYLCEDGCIRKAMKVDVGSWSEFFYIIT